MSSHAAAEQSSVFVVVSGLPGSGKSTLARDLARELSLPWIDKDAILEALFESLGTGDQPWRERLSRASDEILYATAERTQGAVLDNWWHHDSSPQRLRQLPGRLIEVFCDCPIELATERFLRRVRHPGHLDPELSPPEIAARNAQLRRAYPGPLHVSDTLLRADTSSAITIEQLANDVRQHIALLGYRSP
jgi:adenylate kinase family enzyme